MSEKLKPCPFCGSEAGIPTNLDGTPVDYEITDCSCKNDDCLIAGYWTPIKIWQTRPIEDDLRKRIAELEAAQRWRVVADGELPEFGTSILFYDSILEKINKGTCTALGGNKNNLQWYTDDNLFYHGNRCEYITHWLPLPPNPESPNDTQTQTIVYGKDVSRSVK